jgi:hypothetical protein
VENVYQCRINKNEVLELPGLEGADGKDLQDKPEQIEGASINEFS